MRLFSTLYLTAGGLRSSKKFISIYLKVYTPKSNHPKCRPLAAAVPAEDQSRFHAPINDHSNRYAYNPHIQYDSEQNRECHPADNCGEDCGKHGEFNVPCGPQPTGKRERAGSQQSIKNIVQDNQQDDQPAGFFGQTVNQQTAGSRRRTESSLARK